MIILMATVQARKGCERELEKAMREIIPETAKENGVMEYRLHKSLDVEGHYAFYEKYRDKDVLVSHLASTHFQALSEKFKQYVDGEPKIELFEFMDGISES
ncbi:MAG: putative quinol monooxygenase [Desulfovibrio sp.]|uniref:putative quinol monooxygenase n=1 Tax=Desulfovibrio sp. 7SRBS1 TaxID=3378064 RepID=UPI003B41AFB5